MTTAPAGPGAVDLTVEPSPPDAVEEVDMFEVMSWQGGALVITPLEEVSHGIYRSEQPVPVGGDWKTMVRLADKDVMAAVPVFMPRDPEIGAGEIPVVPERTAEFRRDTELLMREAHAGAAWPATVAYTSILCVAIVWILTLAIGFAKVGSDRPPGGRERRRVARAAVTT